jgi:hypothetical protein
MRLHVVTDEEAERIAHSPQPKKLPSEKPRRTGRRKL